jgi:hypothetical protein
MPRSYSELFGPSPPDGASKGAEMASDGSKGAEMASDGSKGAEMASDGSKGATSPARGQPAEMCARGSSEHAAPPAPRSSLAEEGDGSGTERTAAGRNGSSAKETSGSSSGEIRGPDVDEVARLFSLREQLLADLAGVGTMDAPGVGTMDAPGDAGVGTMDAPGDAGVGTMDAPGDAPDTPDTPDTPAAGGGGAAEHPADAMRAPAPAAVVSAHDAPPARVRGASSLPPRAAEPEAAREATAPSAGGTAPRGSPVPKVLPTREVLSNVRTKNAPTDVPGAPAPDDGSNSPDDGSNGRTGDDGSNGRTGDAEKASSSSGAGAALEQLGSGAGAAAGDGAAPPEDAESGAGAAQAGGSGGQGSGRWGRGGAGQTLRLSEGTTKVLHQAGGDAA